MAVKKTAAEQPAETTVNAGLALRRLGVSIYVGPSILGYIQKNTIYPCAAAEAVNRDDVKIATEKYHGVADFIIDMDELHTTPEKAKARGEAILWQIMVLTSAAPTPPWRPRTPQPAAFPLSSVPHRCPRQLAPLQLLAPRCSAPATPRRRNSWVTMMTGQSTPFAK